MYKLRLKETREALNLSLKDVSSLTGISESNLSLMERGVQSPTMNTINRIAEALPTEGGNLVVWTNSTQ